jgi:hypothetical protein
MLSERIEKSHLRFRGFFFFLLINGGPLFLNSHLLFAQPYTGTKMIYNYIVVIHGIYTSFTLTISVG